MQASYGFEFNVDAVQIKKHLAFHKSNFRKRGLSQTKIIGISVRDDSMQPTLKQRDTILINTADKSLQESKIVALLSAGQLLVKRMRRLNGQIWLACSDNIEYPPFEVKVNSIVGTMVWFGRWN